MKAISLIACLLFIILLFEMDVLSFQISEHPQERSDLFHPVIYKHGDNAVAASLPGAKTNHEEVTASASAVFRRSYENPNKPVSASGPAQPEKVEAFVPTTGYSVQLSALNVAPDLSMFSNTQSWQTYIKWVPPYYKVLAGPFTDRAAATAAMNDFQKHGYSKAFLVKEDKNADYYWRAAGTFTTDRSSEKNNFGEAYLVKKGDTLVSIAKKYRLTEDYLKKLNNLADNKIDVNQVLRLE